ncbi:hypothetical protein BDV98DRAFT_597846 [Pterulicium gracile]|uniref:Uncharacterized protein n=1 Tax=Pterulicium gracile TaxID=1884261 RepID=A0A5C3Q4U1_9AGAR|nr:hypothetical protein BDV98DRAFT_597846 [Pterula gracilis]
MAKHISFVKSYFVALWIQTLIYGSYVVLFFGCMYILLFRRPVSCPKITPSFVLALFMLSTAHVIINLFKGVKAFTVVVDPNIIFADFSAPIDLAKESVYITAAALADTLLIFRCYMVWGHNWRVAIVPVMLLLLSTGAGYTSVYQFSTLEDRDGAQYAENLKKWFMVLYSVMLANNILSTTLIASRIWWRSRQSGSALGWRHQAKYNWIIAIVIESGAIYSFSLLIYLVLYTIESQAQKLILDSLCQIASIMPTLIIVRIGLGMGPHDISPTFQTTIPNSRHFSSVRFRFGANPSLVTSVRNDQRHSVVDIRRMEEARLRDDASFALHPAIVDEGRASMKM